MTKTTLSGRQVGRLRTALQLFTPPQGFHVSAFWIVGARHPMGKFPVKSPEDVKGKKMRVVQSPLHIEIWKSLGANPTPIPTTEIYNSVQSGTVEVLDNSISTYWFSKFYEVAPYFTTWVISTRFASGVFSESFGKRYRRLPEGHRPIRQRSRALWPST